MAEALGKAVVVQAVFRRCVELKRELMETVERCALKGWPDRKAPLRNAFRLQELFNEREALRFDHLATICAPEAALWKSFSSISNISKRINEEWTEGDEEALKGNSPTYRNVLTEISDCAASADTAALDGPLVALRRDSEYHAARQKVYEIFGALDEQLAQQVD